MWRFGRVPDYLASQYMHPGFKPADPVWDFQRNILVSPFSMSLGNPTNDGLLELRLKPVYTQSLKKIPEAFLSTSSQIIHFGGVSETHQLTATWCHWPSEHMQSHHRLTCINRPCRVCEDLRDSWLRLKRHQPTIQHRFSTRPTTRPQCVSCAFESTHVYPGCTSTMNTWPCTFQHRGFSVQNTTINYRWYKTTAINCILVWCSSLQ